MRRKTKWATGIISAVIVAVIGVVTGTSAPEEVAEAVRLLLEFGASEVLTDQ